MLLKLLKSQSHWETCKMLYKAFLTFCRFINTFYHSEQPISEHNMFWTTRAGCFLSFMWKLNTTDVQDLNKNTAQSVVKSVINGLKSSHLKLVNVKKAIMRYKLHLTFSQTFCSLLNNLNRLKPHFTAKVNGRIDLLHVNF